VELIEGISDVDDKINDELERGFVGFYFHLNEEFA
jgi:hypothetical protein